MASAGRFRHPDHRFEWSRAEFHNWASRVAAEHAEAVAARLIEVQLGRDVGQELERDAASRVAPAGGTATDRDRQASQPTDGSSGHSADAESPASEEAER
jgi:hypothetical protein